MDDSCSSSIVYRLLLSTRLVLHCDLTVQEGAQPLGFGFDALADRGRGGREHTNLDDRLGAPGLVFPHPFHIPVNQHNSRDPTLWAKDPTLVRPGQDWLDIARSPQYVGIEQR